MQEFTAIVEVDKQGRVTIPPAIRKALHIEKGSIIKMSISVVNLSARGQNENPCEALVLA
jgi:AbrB family looped-hinge helix DNA binding protein